jgi:hypothetical protein
VQLAVAHAEEGTKISIATQHITRRKSASASRFMLFILFLSR